MQAKIREFFLSDAPRGKALTDIQWLKTVDLTYSPSGQLSGVSNNRGRSLSFSYDTALLPNGSAGFYVTLVNSSGGTDAYTGVGFTLMAQPFTN